MIELKKEEKAEIKIAFWLIENGCKVYFNRNSQKYNLLFSHYEIFKTKGLKTKPDIVFFDPAHNFYVALEIKPSDNSLDVRKGCKIIIYNKDYCENRTEYYIDNKKIEIKHFLLATDKSINGKLFDENNIEKVNQSENEGKYFAYKFGQIPYSEYKETHNFIRELWQQWSLFGKDNKAGIGFLLSSCLDENGNYPAIFSQEKGRSWRQCWKIIK